jgi:transposase-like protein
LEEARLCCLVIVGVRLDGTKELVAIADLLRDLRRRGMRAPVIAVGDGALGFWAALRDEWPQTREQRDWVHKAANTLDALPKAVQPTAKKMLAEIRDAEDRDHALAAAKRFDGEFRARWPKAADKIRDNLDRLLTFYDFPAEHWLHLKTSNPIESTFSTVRLRTKVTKGPGSRAAGLAMAFKLIESAQDRWRAVNGPPSSPSCEPAQPSERGCSSRTNRRTGRSPRDQRRNLIHNS